MKQKGKKKGIIWKIIVALAVFAAIGVTAGEKGETSGPVASGEKSAEELQPAEDSAEKRPVLPSSAESQNLQQISDEVDDSYISPELIAFLDSYESFVDEYCAFMKNYNASDLTMLAQYTSLVRKELEFAEQVEQYDEDTMTTAEALYYAEVMLRCASKMAKI